MSDRTIGLIWSLSLVLIGITTLVRSVADIFFGGLPDTPVRILGIMQLILIPALAGSWVAKIRRDKKGKRNEN